MEMKQTALQFLEWRWPEVYKDIPKGIVDECFELEKEIIIKAFNEGNVTVEMSTEGNYRLTFKNKMEKQISAVEWLVDMLDIDKNDSSTKDVIDQAKEMEKAERTKEYVRGFNDGKEFKKKLDELTFKSE